MPQGLSQSRFSTHLIAQLDRDSGWRCRTEHLTLLLGCLQEAPALRGKCKPYWPLDYVHLPLARRFDAFWTGDLYQHCISIKDKASCRLIVGRMHFFPSMQVGVQGKIPKQVGIPRIDQNRQ
jgi:hypothetical protein